MASKLTILLLICVVSAMQGMAKENNEKRHGLFGKQLGCSPPEEWNLLKESSKGTVCLPKNYQVNEPPEIGNLTSVQAFFVDTKILNVDERDKSVTMVIKRS